MSDFEQQVIDMMIAIATREPKPCPVCGIPLAADLAAEVTANPAKCPYPSKAARRARDGRISQHTKAKAGTS